MSAKYKTEKIWFALVGLQPLKGNEIVPEAKSAYVNVACVANGQESLTKKLHENFTYHKFKIIEITDIETEENITIDDKKTSAKIKLLKEIKEGNKFAWGKFFFTKT